MKYLFILALLVFMSGCDCGNGTICTNDSAAVSRLPLTPMEAGRVTISTVQTPTAIYYNSVTIITDTKAGIECIAYGKGISCVKVDTLPAEVK